MNKGLFLQGECWRANPPKCGAGHREGDGGSRELCQGRWCCLDQTCSLCEQASAEG